MTLLLKLKKLLSLKLCNLSYGPAGPLDPAKPDPEARCDGFFDRSTQERNKLFRIIQITVCHVYSKYSIISIKWF